MTSLRRFLLVVSVPLVGLIVAGALAPRAETRTDATLKDLKVFSETLALVDRQYVDDVDFRQLERGAYQGLAESLDPWSSFHDPAQLKALLARDQSADVGILLLKHPQQYVRVAVVVPGSPADVAEILRGEFIETIDGLETKDLTLEEAQLMLAGPPGSILKLGFFREADDQAGRVVDLKRADLTPLRSVVERREKTAASLRVTDTRPGIAKIVAAQLAELARDGVTSLVLDLRANVGGTPQDAAELASLFTGPGPMFQRQTRNGSATIAGDSAKAWNGKLVVLASRATLGEAELVAEALRTRLGVPVVGQPTFGKTTQQDLVLLSDGTGLWMSVAEYRRADGSAYPDDGLEPDEKIASRRVEPVLVERDDDEEGSEGETGDEAAGGEAVESPTPGEAIPAPPALPAGETGATPPADNKFPTLPGVTAPPAPGHPLTRDEATKDEGDPQLDRAFEILAGSPLKKAA